MINKTEQNSEFFDILSIKKNISNPNQSTIPRWIFIEGAGLVSLGARNGKDNAEPLSLSLSFLYFTYLSIFVSFF